MCGRVFRCVDLKSELPFLYWVQSGWEYRNYLTDWTKILLFFRVDRREDSTDVTLSVGSGFKSLVGHTIYRQVAVVCLFNYSIYGGEILYYLLSGCNLGRQNRRCGLKIQVPQSY